MKISAKRIILSICAISVSAMLVTANVYATERRSQPGTQTSSSITTSAGEEADASAQSSTTGSGVVTSSGQTQSGGVVNDTTSNITTQAAAEASSNRYLSKTGGFLWFLLSVVVNFIISCWIANRFYKLSRKSAQSSAEIRALRKDIEEKFASTIRDISEPAIEVVNSNEDYSRTDEGIPMPNRHPKVEITDEEREILKKWDSRQSRSHEQSPEPEYEDEYDEIHERSFNSYQPTRKSSGIVFADEDEYEDEPERESVRKPRIKSKDFSKAKNKAKNLLNNIFPFDE